MYICACIYTYSLVQSIFNKVQIISLRFLILKYVLPKTHHDGIETSNQIQHKGPKCDINGLFETF